MLCESNPQSVIVVKSPTKTAETKKFLGYEWSNRKGSEGIKYLGAVVEDDDNEIAANKGIQQIETPLFDPHNLFNDEKINTLFRKNYLGEDVDVPEGIGENVNSYLLEDMLDFKRVDFDKAIKTTPILVYPKIECKEGTSTEKLSVVAPYVTDTIKMSSISVADYISTDNMLQNRAGVVTYEGVPNIDSITEFKKGDILVSNIRPYLKKIWMADRDGGCSKDVLVFRNSKPTEVMNDYLKVIMSTDTFFDYMMVGKKGVKMPRGDKKIIPNFEIPIPSIEIQQKIADECMKVDDEVSTANKYLANCHNAINAIILPCFDKYNTVVLKSICDSFEYGTSEKSTPLGKVPVLRMGNIVDGTIDWNDLVFTSNELDIEKLSLKKGDVLFNRTNSPIHVGKTAIYEEEKTAIFAGYIIRVNYKKDTIRGKYLSYILNSDPMMQHGFSIMKKSINQANISASLLSQYEIPLPSLKEQDEIISKLEIIESEKKRSRLIIADASALKQGILDKYLK